MYSDELKVIIKINEENEKDKLSAFIHKLQELELFLDETEGKVIHDSLNNARGIMTFEMNKIHDNKKKHLTVTVDLKNTEHFQNMLSLIKAIYETTSEEKVKDLILSEIHDIACTPATSYKERFLYYEQQMLRLNEYIADNCYFDINEKLLGVEGGYVNSIIAIIEKNQKELYEVCKAVNKVPEILFEISPHKLMFLNKKFHEGECSNG